MILIDAHCHFEGREFEASEELVARAREAGLVHAIVVGQFHAPGDFGKALDAAARFPDFLTATMGIHPHEAANATPEDLRTLEQLCARPDVHAVGEAGLDYYYDHSPREIQRENFAWQCELARKVGKPLIVHVRDAHDECFDILSNSGLQEGMIHCFTGNLEQGKRYLDLGFHLSISGVVTYKKTEALREAVAYAPMDRLMVETDSPYLAPVPHRGKRNEPGFVRETAKKVAELKGLAPEAVALQAAHNTKRLLRLGIDLPPLPA